MSEEKNSHRSKNPGASAAAHDAQQAPEPESPASEIEQLRTQLAEVRKNADTLPVPSGSFCRWTLRKE